MSAGDYNGGGDRLELAELRGRVIRIDSDVERLKGRYSDLFDTLEGMRGELIGEIRGLKDRFDAVTNWEETTEVRQRRRHELERVRLRAEEADLLESRLVSTARHVRRSVPVWSTAVGALLYALAELVRSLVHH